MKRQVIQQHNAITTARYDMSSAEKNVFYLLLAQLNEKGFNEKTYKISVKELADIQEQEIDHIQFKKTSKKLLNQVLSIPTQNGNFTEISLVNSAEYLKGYGSIELDISKEIRQFLFELKNNFTQFNLRVGLKLKSKYAKRIYEMLSQYKDTGFMIINIEELKQRLCLIDSTTNKDKYPIYGLFKAKVLEIAQKELQQKADIWFNYKAKKVGRKYTQLFFKIIKKENTVEIHSITETRPMNVGEMENSTPYKKLVEKYKLSTWQAKNILQNVPLEEIHKTTYDIQLEVLNNKVRNVGAYTAKVFDEKYSLNLFKKV